MRALALHGVMPGHRTPIPQMVRLASPHQRFHPVPRRQVYRPPMMAQPSKKKMAGAFDVDAIPLSLALGALGVGGMYLSGVLPSPVKQIVFVLGIGSVSVGILNLFSGEAYGRTPDIPPKEVPPEERIPEIAPGQIAQGIDLSFPRTQPNTGGVYRSLYAEQEYEFTVRNNWSTPVSFYAGLAIFDNDPDLTKVWISPKSGADVARRLVTVQPGRQTTTKLIAPAMAPQIISPLWADAMIVEVQLFRDRESSDWFKVSTPIPITYSWLG